MDSSSDISSVVNQVEKDLVEEIVEKLKSNNLKPDRAKTLAKEFLSHLPPKDLNALVEVLRDLTTKYTEVREVYARYYGMQGDMEDAKRIHAMAEHINQGNIEKAIEVAKEGVKNA